jgi:hypothetical protein
MDKLPSYELQRLDNIRMWELIKVTSNITLIEGIGLNGFVLAGINLLNQQPVPTHPEMARNTFYEIISRGIWKQQVDGNPKPLFQNGMHKIEIFNVLDGALYSLLKYKLIEEQDSSYMITELGKTILNTCLVVEVESID